MNKFLDKVIYNKAKKKADEVYKKHSAYKSMYLLETYKKLGGKINSKLKKNSGTDKWNKEEWKNLTPYILGKVKSIKDSPACGERHKLQGNNPSICRPTRTINKETPKLAQQYNKTQIKKALEIKRKGKRIFWNKL